jgi:hypothetical protein
MPHEQLEYNGIEKKIIPISETMKKEKKSKYT